MIESRRDSVRLISGQFQLIARSLTGLNRSIEAIETKTELSPQQRDELRPAFKAWFDANKARHPGLVWAKIQTG